MSEMIIAVFKKTNEARFAVASLRDAGFPPESIGLLAHDADAETDFRILKDMESHFAGKGAAIGAAAGAGTGVVWALAVAAGLLPAVGPIVAGGMLGAILTSGAVGAAAAGVAGALVGLGISDEEAAYFEEEFREGGTIVAVTRNDVAPLDRAQAILTASRGLVPPAPRPEPRAIEHSDDDAPLAPMEPPLGQTSRSARSG